MNAFSALFGIICVHLFDYFIHSPRMFFFSEFQSGIQLVAITLFYALYLFLSFYAIVSFFFFGVYPVVF